jgi:hypothetical protein
MRTAATLLFIAACAVFTPAIACFDDKELDQFVPKSPQRGTLVYVWSPRMVYSVHNMAVASRAAAAAGLDFLALHDQRVPIQELPPTPATSRALCSAQLIERDALRHFPSAFVITAQGIHPHAVVGAMPASAWASSIAQRLVLP